MAKVYVGILSKSKAEFCKGKIASARRLTLLLKAQKAVRLICKCHRARSWAHRGLVSRLHSQARAWCLIFLRGRLEKWLLSFGKLPLLILFTGYMHNLSNLDVVYWRCNEGTVSYISNNTMVFLSSFLTAILEFRLLTRRCITHDIKEEYLNIISCLICLYRRDG
jgi:hypothetical protein